MLGGSASSARAAAARDRPCTSQAECRLLESSAPSGIAGQDMADSGEGAAKRCEIDVDLPSRSSDGGGPRGAARPLQDLLDSTHEDDGGAAGPGQAPAPLDIPTKCPSGGEEAAWKEGCHWFGRVSAKVRRPNGKNHSSTPHKFRRQCPGWEV